VSSVVNKYMIKRQDSLPAAAFLRVFGSCVIDQKSPHHLSHQGHEMAARSSLRRSLTEYLHIYFVDQRRRLQRVIRPFPAKLVGSHSAKVRIQEREQAVLCRTVAILNPPKQLRYFSGTCDHLLFSEDTSFSRDPEFPRDST